MTGGRTYTTSEIVPSYCLKSEVSITLSLSAMFNPLCSISNQKAPLQSMHTERNGATRPSYRLKSEVSITLRCRLCSTRYTAVWIKSCLKSTSAIKIATMTNTDDFRNQVCYKGKPSRVITKSTLFAVSKDEWDTKEDTGKSMKNALYVLRYAKMHLLG